MSSLYYENAILRFSCTGCGACCCGPEDGVVELSEKESERIRRYLKVSKRWFRQRYLNPMREGGGLRMNANGSCIFLSGQGACRVYSVRPVQCRTYPFWPEIVSTKRAWRDEAKRCEGIGRGKVIAKKHIRTALVRLDGHQ